MHNIICEMVVILYNPSEEQVAHLHQYANLGYFRRIYVYDNSAKALNVDRLPTTVEYHFMNSNRGLSIPYNMALKDAIDNGADYLCVMDQDSEFSGDDIEKILSYLEENNCTELNTAVVCPIIETDENKQETQHKKGVEIIKWTINSGSFLNLALLKKNSISYAEKVFLDGVDYDFCYSIHKKKLKILRLNESKLFQTFGYRSGKSSFTKHNASRYYNIAHNRKYILKKHYGIAGWLVAALANIRLSMRILLNEESKREKVLACIKGIFK